MDATTLDSNLTNTPTIPLRPAYSGFEAQHVFNLLRLARQQALCRSGKLNLSPINFKSAIEYHFRQLIKLDVNENVLEILKPLTSGRKNTMDSHLIKVKPTLEHASSILFSKSDIISCLD